jgi:hypothetical protein
MARRRGDDDLARECHEVFQRGRDTLEARLWNGEYYIQEVDLEKYPEQNWGLGCHSDHLLGQWWAHVLGLGHLLDPEHVRSALNSIVRYNFREDFSGFWQSFSGQMQEERQFVTEEDAGLVMCTWPKGGRPEVPTRYSDEVWTGIEYEVAALLLYEGQGEDAVTILDAARRRYDGRKQNPWNDIECGDHYVRAMSSWSLLEAASGYRYDAAANALTFSPVISPEEFRAPFITRDGWGTYSQQLGADGARYAIEVVHGEVEVAELRVSIDRAIQDPEVTVGGTSIPCSVDGAGGGARSGSEMIVTPDHRRVLAAGESLVVTLR